MLTLSPLHYRLRSPFPPESIMATLNVVLTFESVDEILRCEHSNEISLAVLSHTCSTVCFAGFDKDKI